MSNDKNLKNDHRLKISAIKREAIKQIFEQTGLQVRIILTYPENESQIKAEMLLLNMCACWGVTPEWLRVPSQKEDRPIMRRIFWMAAKAQIPQVTYKVLAVMAGVSNHVTAVRGIAEAQRWLDINDPLFMKYYNSAFEYVIGEPSY